MSGNPRPKQPKGIDEGFCLLYLRLSYRRKFIRTLWVMLASPILLFLSEPDRVLWFAVTLATGILQALYNYWKWQSEMRE